MTDDAPVIVIVEDDPHIADLVELYLRRDGFRVYVASDGTAGLAVIRQRRPALIVLDLGLPGQLDGIDVCREVRTTSDVPIIVLTARDSETDSVLALELGADDYVVKPFSARELVARVKAILRRASGPRRDDRPVVELGSIVVDLRRHEVRRDGEVVPLASKELALLAFLVEHRGMALTRRQLLDGAWGVDWVGDERTVDVHVRQLRRKLGEGLRLETVWGTGYRLD
ncbi:MAG: response regulator transcription factor [Actinomycetota bacterium]|nr:response regulator transcription factor [Actinomycetota bacterium]